MDQALRAAALILCLTCGAAWATPPAALHAVLPGGAPSLVRISAPMPLEVPSDPFEPRPAHTDMVHKATVSGATLMLVTIVTYNRDCSAGDPVQVKTMTPPDHGEITIRQGKAYPGHRHGILGADCSGIELPATMAYYRSTKGFTGHDAVVLRRYSSDGNTSTMRFDISVE